MTKYYIDEESGKIIMCEGCKALSELMMEALGLLNSNEKLEKKLERFYKERKKL